MVLKMFHLWFFTELRVLPDIGTQGDSAEKNPVWPHDRRHGRDCTPWIGCDRASAKDFRGIRTVLDPGMPRVPHAINRGSCRA